MAQSPLNGATHPVDIEEEGRSSTMDRGWLKKMDPFVYDRLQNLHTNEDTFGHVLISLRNINLYFLLLRPLKFWPFRNFFFTISYKFDGIL